MDIPMGRLEYLYSTHILDNSWMDNVCLIKNSKKI